MLAAAAAAELGRRQAPAGAVAAAAAVAVSGSVCLPAQALRRPGWQAARGKGAGAAKSTARGACQVKGAIHSQLAIGLPNWTSCRRTERWPRLLSCMHHALQSTATSVSSCPAVRVSAPLSLSLARTFYTAAAENLGSAAPGQDRLA